MTVYLNKQGSAATSETFSKDYIISEPITINDSSSPSLNFVIDLGRMLRFYNANTNFSSPGPDYTSLASKAFFFTTVFEESSFIFVGTPGSVQGYRWAASSSNPSPSATAPSDKLCASSCSVVAGWMTVILDSSGNPLIASVMPDDDNALTVLKGTNYSTTVAGAIDTSAITLNSSTDWSVQYNLGSDLTGTIYNFDPTQAVNSSFDGTFTSTNSNGNAWGQVTFVRRL